MTLYSLVDIIVLMQRIYTFFLLLFTASVLFASDSGAYVPYYRLNIVPGAENVLGRPSWNPSPHPWDDRLVSDRLQRSNADHWSEGSWSRRLGSAFSSLYLHIPLDKRFLDGASPDPRHISFLKSVVGNGKVRIFLSLIGTSADFMPLVSEDEKRKDFAETIASLCAFYELDGFDLDWEFASSPRSAEIESIESFVKTLRNVLPAGTVLSAAVSRWRLPDKGFFDSVDEVHLMAYNGGGRHATYESAVADAEIVLARTKIPSEKLILGLPYYGRDYRTDSPQYWTDAKSYGDISNEFNPGPDEDEAGGYAFNGPSTIVKKITWAHEKELGGVFVWEPFQDSNGTKSLTAALRNALRDQSNPTKASREAAKSSISSLP